MAHVFFDLDGTLTDSAEGITRCLAHAVRQLGHQPPPDAELTIWIGTALRDIFRELLETDDETSVDRAVALYRERFDRVGIRENRLYPGVEAGLGRLRAAGYALHVATAKFQGTADDVLALFGLADYFQGVHGTRPEQTDKGAMLAGVLAERLLDPARCFMVGDRNHDVVAARSNGMRSIWVEWGYGTAIERNRAQPDYVVSEFGELLELLTSVAPAAVRAPAAV